ncbi:hypothetical protein [Rhizobium sp. Leaf341]|uniref:hypothetical protein n=1 Tax=Rhizobium sp. Leaf341 TaxID=1736344 RepID=UPI00071528C7|nr:hypothetical protein [Rhizobium sp. Leaf341]KQR69079.1 hypothetical protein ASG03_07645 [Rhizobium sp. Leaf341]
MNPAFPEQSPEQIDGRLNAYRRLLICLMTYVARDPEGRDMLQAMARDTEVVADHEEDPGVMPDEGFAGQNHADAEIRVLIAAALTRAEALAATRAPAP